MIRLMLQISLLFFTFFYSLSANASNLENRELQEKVNDLENAYIKHIAKEEELRKRKSTNPKRPYLSSVSFHSGGITEYCMTWPEYKIIKQSDFSILPFLVKSQLIPAIKWQLVREITRTIIPYIAYNCKFLKKSVDWEHWWYGGQNWSNQLLENLLENFECLNKSESIWTSELKIQSEAIVFGGYPILPRLLIKIKKGNEGLIKFVIGILAMECPPNYSYSSVFARIRPIFLEDKKLSLEKAVELWKDKLKGRRNYDKQEVWPVPSIKVCWNWWKENWQNYIIPFPDQDYEAIEAEIINADPTYVPLAKRKKEK